MNNFKNVFVFLTALILTACGGGGGGGGGASDGGGYGTTPTNTCLLYTSPSPRDGLLSRMPSSA